jgi:3-methyladenine DNA glycosylase AlkD
MMTAEPFHEEVLRALRAAAPVDPTAGERIRLDRKSELVHLGVATPTRRRIVRRGFSFSYESETDVLAVWDAIWHQTLYADVLFAVLDHYRDALRCSIPPRFWKVASRWIDRIDNWAHADDLARVYSWVLAAERDFVLQTLRVWNTSPDQWRRRISIVSLIHYSGPNAAFIPASVALPLVANCVDDERSTVQNAVGWVLREISRKEPEAVIEFLETHRELPAATIRRATERFEPRPRTAR